MFFQAQIVSKSMAAGASPQTPLGSLQRSPSPLTAFNGSILLTFKEGERKEGRRKETEKGRKWVGARRNGKELVGLGLSPPKVKFLVTSLLACRTSVLLVGLIKKCSQYNSGEK